ncbi:MAG: chitobiase/beta-hexosaminidase C-terminal domain-containing protein, partial [Bacteroidales bacterium]|nr:chitobiase/beta-hexosaminidase C-terminal domain-containing protein [Bacteroidales bacterium]
MLYISSIKITWEVPDKEPCAAPTFSVSEGTYYGFNKQTKEITLSCSTKDATIMYSINGGEEQTYKSPISITCQSTTTISAYAKMADGSLGNSATVSKAYNYVVYPSVASIAEFKTKGAADADKTKPYMFTCPLTVTYQNGSRLYLRDEAGDAILVFGAIDKTYEAGNQLPANAIVGTYTVYNQMAEIIPVAGIAWPESNATADASPIEMTIAQLNAVTEA